MFDRLKNYFLLNKNQEILTYLWFFLLCVLCYGILIPFLGFYWDDLPYLYQFHTFGLAGFPEYVASDRPFSAWIFMLTTGLFKFNPLGYHLLAFSLRFISVVLFYQILKEIWPDNPDFSFFASSIFAIYPGFLQQPIALIYCHHLSVLDIFLLSILLMIRVAKAKRINILLFITSLLGTLSIFSIENFATLELIRPFLLWRVLNDEGFNRKRLLQRTLLLWFPYFTILVGFLMWRVVIFKFPTYQPDFFDAFSQNPSSTFFDLIKRIPVDLYTATIGAWIKSLTIPQISTFGKSATFIFWILVLFSLILTLVASAFRSKFHQPDKVKEPGNHSFLIIGFILFFLAGSIVWVLGLPLEIKFAWDRMTLAFIPSVAILFGAVLHLLKKFQVIRNWIFAILISLAVGSHFENGMRFKRDWENFQLMQWQLSWRVPDLEKDTTFTTSEMGLNFYSDNSLTSPLNLLYSDQKNKQLEYLLYFTDVRFGLGLKSLEKGLPIIQKYRSFSFSGNTSQIIAYKYNPPSCLQIMDRIYSNSITNPNLSELQAKELRMTNLSLIKNEPQNLPPTYLFGNEPERPWCYYFEKADLARQYGDYAQIIKLGDEAYAKGLLPRSASEWLPFLEGYCWKGQWEKIEFILDEISASEGNYQQGMCYTLRRIKNNELFPYPEKIQGYLKSYNCH
jgi:hypothetical protein